jgi:steroid 5-alpha reductase family enzyme
VAELLTISAWSIAILMLATWVVSVLINDASIVDIVWGVGFVVATWAAFLVNSVEMTNRTLLVLILITLWGLRLTGYLVWRSLGQGEDRRYQQMRRKRPDSFWLSSLFIVFIPQAVAMWVVAIPPVVTLGSAPALLWLDYVGAALWLLGMVFETVSDLQLARFMRKPESKGQVLDRGLWRYSRHPNYFGDFCVWWGVYLVALAAGHWWTIFAPIVMSVLLIRVSGVGLLEKTIARRRPGYAEYVGTTNSFFPGPPKKTG